MRLLHALSQQAPKWFGPSTTSMVGAWDESSIRSGTIGKSASPYEKTAYWRRPSYAETLSRMHDVMAGYVERGDVAGIVTLLSRRGEVHVDPVGMKAVGGSDPMRPDTVFRIASMTKPITAADRAWYEET